MYGAGKIKLGLAAYMVVTVLLEGWYLSDINARIASRALEDWHPVWQTENPDTNASVSIVGENVTLTIFEEPGARAHLVVRSHNDAIYYRSCNGSSWSDWIVLPGRTAFTPAAAVFNGRLHMVIAGLNHHALWWGSVNLTTQEFYGWTRLSGNVPSAPTLAASSESLYLLVRGGGLIQRPIYRVYNGSSWSDWIVLPGRTAFTPAAAVFNGRLHMVIAGLNHHALWWGSVNLTTQEFYGWTRLSGNVPSAPTLAASSESLYLVICGADDRIYYRSYYGSSWTGWAYPGSQKITADSPAAAVLHNELHIVVRGLANDELWHGEVSLVTDDFSGWVKLSGSTPSAPTLACARACEQLESIAFATLDTMLMDTGYPSNWGSASDFDADQVERFGLALSGSHSSYVLDPDKVQRLVVGNPSGSLNYETVRDLLGLQGYGFNVRIMPLFNVAVEDRTVDNHLLFDVNATFRHGGPIPDATVSATILYVSGQRSDNFNITILPETKTDELGKCAISHTLPEDFAGYILTLRVTVADLATVTVPYLEGFAQNVANVSIIGDTVTVSIREDEHPSERTIHNVTVVTAEDVWNFPGVGCGRTPEDHMTLGEGYQYWTEIFPGLAYEDALFLVFNIWTQEDSGPKSFVLFAASPLLNLATGVLELGGQPSMESINSAAIRLCRSVEIAHMTYIFELLLWKET